MNKKEFLNNLQTSLHGLPEDEIAERVTFYSEMIDDRMEEGLTEEEAVDAIGRDSSVPPTERREPEELPPPPKKKMKAWEIVLIAAGFPLWISLLLAAFAVILALYASLWAGIVSLWASFGAVVGSSLGAIVSGAGFVAVGVGAPGIAIVGAGLVLSGLSVFLFFGCRAATRGAVWLTKRPFARKNNTKKEAAV